MGKIIKSFSFWVFVITLVLSYWAGINIRPSMVVQKVTLDVKTADVGEDAGKLFYIYKGKSKFIEPVDVSQSKLLNKELVPQDYSDDKDKNVEYVFDTKGDETTYQKLEIKRHFGIWSLLPALVAVILCWVLKDPVSSLGAGIFSGALLLQRYDIPDQVFLETFMSKSAAGVLLLYLWLLGGLMGIWSKTGAAKAFAQFCTEKFVRGPRSAKLVQRYYYTMQ